LIYRNKKTDLRHLLISLPVNLPGNAMSKADEYRAKSLQFAAEAETATDPYRRADLEWLAQSYRRLAEHADDNDASGVSPHWFRSLSSSRNQS
jgi:hypothetical protein